MFPFSIRFLVFNPNECNPLEPSPSLPALQLLFIRHPSLHSALKNSPCCWLPTLQLPSSNTQSIGCTQSTWVQVDQEGLHLPTPYTLDYNPAATEWCLFCFSLPRSAFPSSLLLVFSSLCIVFPRLLLCLLPREAAHHYGRSSFSALLTEVITAWLLFVWVRALGRSS